MSLSVLKKYLFPLIFVFGAVVFIARNLYLSNRPLIKPFDLLYDDQSSKVLKKIAPPLNLDFSKAQTLSSLETVPRYLVYHSQTGQVYFAKNATDVFMPASFTKLMTAQVALDLVPLETKITATKDSVNKEPTILEMKVGEKFTVAELLRGTIATSANDAAQTLADGAAQESGLKPKDFIHLMNVKTKALGLTKTQFANPDGLDSQYQFSTLTDLAQIIHNVQVNYPEIVAVGQSDRQDIEANDEHSRYYLPNWNGLLGVYPGVNGLKIAYTEGAGYSTIVTASQSGIPLVAIVSGTGSYLERDLAVADLLDAAYIQEKVSPQKITKNQLNNHYKVWGDLARQIQAEIKALKESTQSATP